MYSIQSVPKEVYIRGDTDPNWFARLTANQIQDLHNIQIQMNSKVQTGNLQMSVIYRSGKICSLFLNAYQWNSIMYMYIPGFMHAWFLRESVERRRRIV